MIGNKYRYGLVDLSYLLTRNLYACARGKKPEEYNPGDVVRMTMQTLNKCSRDYNITVDKYVFLKDTWSKTYKGYFRTAILKGLYKDSRSFMDDEKFKKIKSDPNSTQDDIDEAWAELCLNKCKQKAKNILVYEFGKFGVPCIGVDGFEFDDLATIASFHLYNDDKPSVIITKDSDLKWSTSPQVDWFRIPTGGSNPETITYDQVYSEMPEIFKNHNIMPYQYNAVMNAIGESHNDMRRTRLEHADPIETAAKILIYNDYSNIDPSMLETFENQRRSYDLNSFPFFDVAKNKIIYEMPVTGRLGSLEEFHKFCEKNNITGISDKYFNDFISKFDQKLFTGNDY